PSARRWTRRRRRGSEPAPSSGTRRRNKAVRNTQSLRNPPGLWLGQLCWFAHKARRDWMLGKKRIVVFAMLLLLLAAALPAFADAPNFGPAIFADGRAWGTKGLSDLPAPNDRNAHSFDILYSFTNGAPGQLS